MKGTATITLTEAATGRIISQTVEENMVTDALANIFNPPLFAMLHDFNYSNLFREGLPLWKDILAGIMLLGNNVTEDKSNILLGADTIPIGTAASEYDGTNAMRGTLNLNESYQTKDGYHFTWDFGTDKANGTIRCIALTSREFGDSGFQCGDETSGSFLVNPTYIGQTNLDPSAVFEYATGQYLGTFEHGVHLFVELNDDGDLVFRKYRGADPKALCINDTAGLASVSQPVSEHIVTPAFAIAYDDRFFLDPDTKVLYYFGETELLSASSMRIRYTGISLDTFTTVVDDTLDIPKCCTNYYIGAVWRGHVYYLTADGLSEFDASGNLIKDHAVPYAQSSFPFVLNGCLMSQSPTGDIYCCSWGEETSRVYLSRYQFACPCADVTAPYIAVARRRPHRTGGSQIKTKPAVSIVSSYMATINNLSQPVTKTDLHTLKISYDIVN
ncbi:MAG: hypothetical protein ACI4KA_08180 [Oscillospiraceae bacterium]